MGGVTHISDSNTTDENDNTVVVIRGGDNAHTADVIEENGQKKLIVKATNAPQPVGNLIFEYATNGGSNELAVNGSGTPVEFLISPDATLDKIIEGLTFEAFSNGIKIDKFLSLNNELATGISVEIKADDEVFTFLPIVNTMEFDSHFAYGPGRSFQITIASGNDALITRFGPSNPFTLRPQGTFATDDYIKVIINDNLSSIVRLRFIAFGALD